MKKTNTIILVMFFLTACGLVGCESLTAHPTLFDTSSCLAPCWHNVTPGVTTKKEALATFAKFSADGHGVLDRPNQDPDYEDDIRFSTSPKGDNTVFVDTLDGRISAIEFLGEFGGPLTVQHAIELFGEPEGVLVEETSFYDQIVLLNRAKGIAFGWGITADTGGPRVASGDAEISPEISVGVIWFFDPVQFDRFVDAHSLNISAESLKSSLHPWNGYGKIKDKYWPPATP